MADTTTSRKRDIRCPQLIITRKGVVGSGETLEQGQLVSIDASGYYVNLATNARVAGVAVDEYVAGDVATVNYNHVERFLKTDAASTDVGKTAYAADNQTVTLSSNTAILGPIVDYGDGYVDVQLTTRA